MPDTVVKKSEKMFKRLVEAAFRFIFAKGDRSVYPIKPENVRSILVLRPDKLGDMIATIPALHALKAHLPHARIEVIASPHNRDLIADDPDIDAVHTYTKNILHDIPMIRRLKKARFDIVFDPICHDSVTGLILSKWIGRHSIKAAARKLRLRPYYDYCEPYEPDGRDHSIDNSLLVFNVFGIDPASVDPYRPMYLPEDSIRKAEAFYESVPSNCLRVGFNISAGSPSRTLDVRKYIAVMHAVAADYPDAEFIISCAPNERERGEELQRALPGKTHLIPDGRSFRDVCAVISRLDILISPDTSLVHVAGTFGVPVVALYSGHIRNFYFWKPYRQECGWVISNEFHHLLDIEPEQIVDQFRRLVATLDLTEKARPS
ncbi:MAG TPA: glycosyltransferase family 9 protein [candidate division Zixibacteria bacterium]|nr:glycosyltransferase family 9 protein [candidate division Zixibacteria bacterium]